MNFSEATLWFAQPFNVIDAQMAFDGKALPDGRWIMVYKNEDDPDRGGKNLHYSIAPTDFSRPWSSPSPPLVGPGSPIRPQEVAEGCCLIFWNGKWMLYWDACLNGHYGAAISNDLDHWTDMTGELSTPPNPRHGTVFRVPASALETVQAAIAAQAK